MVMAGRFHFYEGYTPQQVVYPVRVMKMLGVHTLLLSNNPLPLKIQTPLHANQKYVCKYEALTLLKNNSPKEFRILGFSFLYLKKNSLHVFSLLFQSESLLGLFCIEGIPPLRQS